MTFTESISSVFSKYAIAKGRATRSEYWWFYLFNILVSLAASVLDSAIGTSAVITSIWNLIVLIPIFCVGIRRLHDTNHSGWWIIVPIANLIMMLMPSDPNRNEYDI